MKWLCTHSPAEEATPGAALVLHHAVTVVLAQNQQLNGVGGTHHFMFQYGTLAAGQLSIHALCGHALPVRQDENLSTLGRLHTAAAERKLLSLLNGRPQRVCKGTKLPFVCFICLTSLGASNHRLAGKCGGLLFLRIFSDIPFYPNIPNLFLLYFVLFWGIWNVILSKKGKLLKCHDNSQHVLVLTHFGWYQTSIEVSQPALLTGRNYQITRKLGDTGRKIGKYLEKEKFVRTDFFITSLFGN